MFKKAKASRTISTARKRAQKSDAAELAQWIDSTLYEIGRSTRERSFSSLEEAQMWTSVLTDLIEELSSRK
jgi:predicted metal-dependent HD superfamily phosphohydrolase